LPGRRPVEAAVVAVGGGRHFVHVQVVERLDERIAIRLGLSFEFELVRQVRASQRHRERPRGEVRTDQARPLDPCLLSLIGRHQRGQVLLVGLAGVFLAGLHHQAAIVERQFVDARDAVAGERLVTQAPE
jgi:hypothetical protein